MTAAASSFSPEDVPRFPRGVRMRFDPVRNAYVLLAPERAFNLDETASAVLDLVDGVRTVDTIIGELQRRYNADRAVIEVDVLAMLTDLSGKGVLGK
jgi:pyrroloquinoline quinone biosynthesis protein D